MITTGDIKVWPLPEGRFTVGLDKEFVPYREGDPLPKGSLFISVTPFLVELPNDLLLLDAGLGRYAAGRDSNFLVENLDRVGFGREDVTKVLLSHLHSDHAGGAIVNVAGEDIPTFPNAEYHVQKDELTGEGYAEDSHEARDLIADVLDRAGQLVTVDGSQRISEHIEAELTRGHTEFHQAFRITLGDHAATFGGDVLPEPAQIKRNFRAKYDLDPEHGQKERNRLARRAADDGDLLLLYHSPNDPAAFVSHGDRGLQIRGVGRRA